MAVTKAVSLKAGIGQAHKNAVELAKNTEVMQITIIPDIFFYFHLSVFLYASTSAFLCCL